jgi:hypothetical protein
MTAFPRYRSLRGSPSESAAVLAPSADRTRSESAGPIRRLLSVGFAALLVVAALCLCLFLPRGIEEE